MVDLLRNLQSIGHACFVRNFDVFANDALSDAQKIDILVRKYGYKLSPSRTRVSKAKAIFQNGLSRQALEIIAKGNADEISRREAVRLLRV